MGDRVTQPIRIEIDTAPRVYLQPDEYTGLLVDRQLHRPLFRPDGRAIVPDLLTAPERLSPTLWRFLMAEDALWGDGEPMHAADVARSIREATDLPRFGWMTRLFRKVTAQDDTELHLETRHPVGRLEAVLATPILGPRDAKRPSGNYRVDWSRGSRTRLRRAGDTDQPDIEILTTGSREEGRRLFREGGLDLGWGIGVPSDFWAQSDLGPFLESVPLDMHYVVLAGRDLSRPDLTEVLEACRLSPENGYGVIASDSRFDTNDATPAMTVRHKGQRSWPLYYSDFPPNHEVAMELCSNAGARLIPTSIDYADFVKGKLPQDGFILQIETAPFPGDVGKIPETAGMLTASGRVSDELSEAACRVWSWDEKQPDGPHDLLHFERAVDGVLARKVVGRLQSRFRGSAGFNLPSTGVFDFTELAKRKEH